MTKKWKQNNISSKNYQIIILASILSLLLFLISNCVNYQKNLIKNGNNLLNKIINQRILEESKDEIISSKKSDEICKNSNYISEDLKNIDELNNYITYGNEDKKCFKTLINNINYIIKEDKNYLKVLKNIIKNKDCFIHMIPAFIFLLNLILSIFGWIIFIVCCCCNCCCCCKKSNCKNICSIFTLSLYLLSIIICIIGFLKSDSIIEGIVHMKCSILEFFEHILEGETNKEFPGWAGLNKIIYTLKDMNDGIKNLKKGTLNDLNREINNIINKEISLKNKMEESGNNFILLQYSNLYSSNDYYMESRGISGRYILDLVKFFGRKAKIINSGEEKYEPENSFLDTWYKEYKDISKTADIYLQETVSDLNTIIDNTNEDIIKNLEEGIDNINKLIVFFNNINKEMEDIFIIKSDKIEKYTINIFKYFFISTGAIYFFLVLYIFILCIFSSNPPSDYCGFRCLLKRFPHILWNILCIIMIISFIFGLFCYFFGTIGNDFVSLISFVISEDNLNINGENLIIDQLEESKDYLDKCINGDGKIIDLIRIKNNYNNALNNLIKHEKLINQIKNEFLMRKSFTTYSFYEDQLKARYNLSIIPMLIKDNYEINLPLNNEINYEYSANKYIKFDIELKLMNNLIKEHETTIYKNEQWKINSNSPNECKNRDTQIYSSLEFNPLKCRPIYRDWIKNLPNNDIKTEAKIISDTLMFLDNAIKNQENDNSSEPQSFITILNNLKKEYG